MFALRKSSPFLVNVAHHIFFDRNQKMVSGYAYTEKIRSRLPNLGLVSFPDSLHLYAQVIYGCEKLAGYFSYFKINPYCIGLNS